MGFYFLRFYSKDQTTSTGPAGGKSLEGKRSGNKGNKGNKGCWQGRYVFKKQYVSTRSPIKQRKTP